MLDALFHLLRELKESLHLLQWKVTDIGAFFPSEKDGKRAEPSPFVPHQCIRDGLPGMRL